MRKSKGLPSFPMPCPPPEGANFAIGLDGQVYVGSDFLDDECIKVRGGMADYRESMEFNRKWWTKRAKELGYETYITHSVDIW